MNSTEGIAGRDEWTWTLAVCTTKGLRSHITRSAATKTTVAAHWTAISHYLNSGDDGPVLQFAGVRVDEMKLAGDPQQIHDLLICGALDISAIYQSDVFDRVIGHD